MKVSALLFTLLFAFIFGLLGPTPCSAQRDKADLRRYLEVASSSGASEEALSGDLQLIASLVEDLRQGKQSEFRDAIKTMEIEPEDVENAFVSLWIELRFSERVPKSRALRVKDLQDGIASMVKLKIVSQPDTADVFLRTEKNMVGKTQVTRWVLPGPIRVIVRKDGYQADDQVIEIEKGKNKEHPVKLQPTP